jgi:hypothetical protein
MQHVSYNIMQAVSVNYLYGLFYNITYDIINITNHIFVKYM